MSLSNDLSLPESLRRRSVQGTCAQAGPAKTDRTRPAPQAVQRRVLPALSCWGIEGQRWLLHSVTRHENSRPATLSGRPSLGWHSVPDRWCPAVPARPEQGRHVLSGGLRNPYRQRPERDRAAQERAAAQERHLPAKSHGERVSRGGGTLRPDAQRVPEPSGWCAYGMPDGAA